MSLCAYLLLFLTHVVLAVFDPLSRSQEENQETAISDCRRSEGGCRRTASLVPKDSLFLCWAHGRVELNHRTVTQMSLGGLEWVWAFCS